MSNDKDHINELVVFQAEEDKNDLVLSEQEKLELAIIAREEDGLRRFQNATKVADFMQTVNKTRDKLLVDAHPTVKLILALNQLLGRSQATKYPLVGMEQITGGTDSNLLTSNFFDLGDEGLTDKFRAYVLINPTDILSEDREPLINQVENVLEPFKEESIEVSLCIYINSVDYYTYQQTVRELDEQVAPYYEYEIVSMLANYNSKSQADVIVTPDTSVSFDLLMSRGLLRAIKHSSDYDKKIYFEPAFLKQVPEISPVDFYLMARREIPNLILSFNDYQNNTNPNSKSLARPTEDYELLARHAKDHWLSMTTGYKFKSEVIEDFFRAPDLVMVQGLSPIIGMITDREMFVAGEMFNLDGSESEPVETKFTSRSFTKVKGVNNEEVLTQLLRNDYRNVRTDIVQIGDKYIRIEEMSSKLTIQGITPASKTPVKGFELTDYTNLRFLCDYFNKPYYDQMRRALGTEEYSLPERFNLYLIRKASRNKNEVSGLDTHWFSKRNYMLPQVLELLGEKVHLDHIIGESISALEGITTNEIVVNLEGLKCHI